MKYPTPAIRYFDGETVEPLPGFAVVRCGGHFPGSSALHWAAGDQGAGAFFTGDTIRVCADARWLSFMYSYPTRFRSTSNPCAASPARSSHSPSTASTTAGRRRHPTPKPPSCVQRIATSPTYAATSAAVKRVGRKRPAVASMYSGAWPVKWPEKMRAQCGALAAGRQADFNPHPPTPPLWCGGLTAAPYRPFSTGEGARGLGSRSPTRSRGPCRPARP